MKMLINGKKVDSRDGKVIQVKSPVTNEIIDTVPMATIEDMDEALNASKAGFKKWKIIPLIEKEEIFNRFYKLLDDHKREIVSVMIKESGSSVRNGLFQYQGLPGLFKGYLESAKRQNGTIIVPGTEPGHDGKTHNDLQLLVHEPLGTVLALIPFNAPTMLFGYKVAPALAAGNSVIVKPPTDNPLQIIKICELLWEAGVPGDALQVITGSGSVIGNYLVNDPRIDAVTLTGSTDVGVNIATTMAKRLAPSSLELGGNDPFVVMEDGDIDIAIKEGTFWRFNAAGQVCISPKRFIIHNSLKDKFIQGAVDFAKTIELAFYLDVDKELDKFMNTAFDKVGSDHMIMNGLISEKAAKEVENQVNHTIEQGGKILFGGKRTGSFYEPTVLEVSKDTDIMKDMEIFGPVMPVCGFDTMEEALEIVNSSCYGLSGCVYTSDWKKGMNMARRIESGGVVVNGCGTYRNMMQPFGGYKMSGVGREGFLTMAEVTQEKVIVLKGFLE